MRRRECLRAAGGVVVAGALAGCDGDGGTDDGANGDGGPSEVLVAPEGGNRFVPESITIGVGEELTWRFENRGHNVSCVPEHHEDVSLPADASPFSSYEGEDTYATVPTGETFAHTFEVAGEYHYVCIPHAAVGMQGTVVVEG